MSFYTCDLYVILVLIYSAPPTVHNFITKYPYSKSYFTTKKSFFLLLKRLVLFGITIDIVRYCLALLLTVNRIYENCHYDTIIILTIQNLLYFMYLLVLCVFLIKLLKSKNLHNNNNEAIY